MYSESYKKVLGKLSSNSKILWCGFVADVVGGYLYDTDFNSNIGIISDLMSANTECRTGCTELEMVVWPGTLSTWVRIYRTTNRPWYSGIPNLFRCSWGPSLLTWLLISFKGSTPLYLEIPKVSTPGAMLGCFLFSSHVFVSRDFHDPLFCKVVMILTHTQVDSEKHVARVYETTARLFNIKPLLLYCGVMCFNVHSSVRPKLLCNECLFRKPKYPCWQWGHTGSPNTFSGSL